MTRSAWQEPRRELETSIRKAEFEVHVIGGAKAALGLDAKTAISDGAELAAKL